MNVKNIPNYLSLLRLALVPFFVISFFLINEYLALGIFCFASLTDLVDGYVARKCNAITELGKVLDPLADKLMKMGALICLSIANYLPLWVTILMVVCDLAMIISGFCIYKKHITIPSNWIGKLGTLVISLGVVLSFFTKWLNNTNVYVVYGGIVIAIIAGLNYVYIFFTKKIKNKKRINKENDNSVENESIEKDTK